MTSTSPSISEMMALPLGMRASNSSSTLGNVRPGDTAGVERPHGELGPRLSDGLGGDHAHRLPNLHQLAGRQVTPVAVAAHAFSGLAGEDGPHLDLVDARLDDGARLDVADIAAFFNKNFLGLWMADLGGGDPAGHPLEERLGQR